MRTTIRVTDPNFEMPSLDDLSHGDQEASYALRGIRHQKKRLKNTGNYYAERLIRGNINKET